MSPGRRSKWEPTLTLEVPPADKSCMASVQASGDARNSAGRWHERDRWHERGQAMVEFAILAPVFILIVAGIIQFGVALNFWLDLQRIANQGARWAVVDCENASGQRNVACGTGTLAQALQDDVISSGNNATAEVCFEATSGSGGTAATIGDPVTVRLNSSFTFVPIVGIGTLDLRGAATMRLEKVPDRLMAEGVTACP